MKIYKNRALWPWIVVLALLSPSLKAMELVAALADEDYPPFYYYDDKAERYAGVSIDICEAVAESLGYTLKFERQPFVRLLYQLSEGGADIACTLFNTSARAPGITFTGSPHVFETISVFGRKGDIKASKHLDIDRIKRHKVGGVRAYFYGKALEDNNGFKKLEVNDETQLIKVLLAERIDYALGNRASILHHARKLGVEQQISFVDEAVYDGPIYIGVSRSRDDALQLASQFTEAVIDFRKTEAYRAILQSYGLPIPRF